MKKYVAEWSFKDHCLKFYDALAFFAENKAQCAYILRADGIYSVFNGKESKVVLDDLDDEPMTRAEMFWDQMVNESLVYCKGTFFHNQIISFATFDTQMSFFETLYVAFRQSGLIIEGRLLDGIDAVYKGFKDAWLDNEKAPWSHQGKLITFKVNTLKY